MSSIKHNLTELQLAELARLAHGFVGADLLLLVKDASFKALRRCHRARLTQPEAIWVEIYFFEAFSHLQVNTSIHRLP